MKKYRVFEAEVKKEVFGSLDNLTGYISYKIRIRSCNIYFKNRREDARFGTIERTVRLYDDHVIKTRMSFAAFQYFLTTVLKEANIGRWEKYCSLYEYFANNSVEDMTRIINKIVTLYKLEQI